MSFVVFLDVDGVLNTETTCKTAPSGMQIGVDDARIRILANAMGECGASGVVLTTTWKNLRAGHENYKYLEDMLLKHGIKILGKTKERNQSQRGIGIMEYIDRNPEIDEFVIIDDNHFDFDDSDMLWENYIDTGGKGIENSTCASDTPTVTAILFLDAIKKEP